MRFLKICSTAYCRHILRKALTIPHTALILLNGLLRQDCSNWMASIYPRIQRFWNGHLDQAVAIEVWEFRVLPWNLTWNLKIMGSERTFLFQGLLFRFHVKFWGCKWFVSHYSETNKMIFPFGLWVHDEWNMIEWYQHALKNWDQKFARNQKYGRWWKVWDVWG